MSNGTTPSRVNCGDGPIAGVGEKNRVTIGGADGDGHAGTVGHQGIGFAAMAWKFCYKYKIRMDLLQRREVIGRRGAMTGPESVVDPAKRIQRRGETIRWHRTDFNASFRQMAFLGC